jgi:hypothetical protein
MNLDLVIDQLQAEYDKIGAAIEALKNISNDPPAIAQAPEPSNERTKPEAIVKTTKTGKLPAGEAKGKIVQFLQKHPNSTKSAMELALALEAWTIDWHLRELLSKKQVIKTGIGKAATYSLIPITFPSKTSSPDKKFFCEPCHATFVDQQHLEEHIKLRHSNEQKFPCDECDKNFATEGDLTAHKLRRHP